MAWVYLVIAGLLEVTWAIALKYSAGFTRPLPTAIVVVALAGSMVLLGMAVRTLPVGTAYAVWTGIGAVGVAVLGMVVLGEPRGAMRILSITLIVAGIVGLKIAHAGE